MRGSRRLIATEMPPVCPVCALIGSLSCSIFTDLPSPPVGCVIPTMSPPLLSQHAVCTSLHVTKMRSGPVFLPFTGRSVILVCQSHNLRLYSPMQRGGQVTDHSCLPSIVRQSLRGPRTLSLSSLLTAHSLSPAHSTSQLATLHPLQMSSLRFSQWLEWVSRRS